MLQFLNFRLKYAFCAGIRWDFADIDQQKPEPTLLSLANHRVTIHDGRTFVGQMIAFDKHMNMVLADCEEFRKVKAKAKSGTGPSEREERRLLGLVVVRGEIIVSMSIEAPPPPSDEQKAKAAAALGGPGIGRPAGRGLPIAPAPGMPPMPGGEQFACFIRQHSPDNLLTLHLNYVLALGGPIRGMGGPAPGMMAPVAGMRPPVSYGRPPMPGMPPGMPPMPGMMPPGMVRCYVKDELRLSW